MKKIERQRVELGQDLDAKVVDGIFADPIQTIIAQITHDTAKADQKRQQQQPAQDLQSIERAAAPRQPRVHSVIGESFYPGDEPAQAQCRLGLYRANMICRGSCG